MSVNQRAELCDGVEELTFENLERLYMFVVGLIGTQDIKIISSGCCLNLDKLNDHIIKQIYEKYQQLMNRKIV